MHLFPIRQTGQVQRWVRWHPYNLDAELLWRGTFATFALALFFTAANPRVLCSTCWNWEGGWKWHELDLKVLEIGEPPENGPVMELRFLLARNLQ